MGTNIQLRVPSGPDHADSPHSAAREAETIRALRELVAQFDSLIGKLRPFFPTDMTDINGHRYSVLASDLGIIAAPRLPWAVVDATPKVGMTKARITKHSAIYTDPDCHSSLTIDEIETEFDVADGKWLFVEVDVNDGIPGDAELKCAGGSGSAKPWPEFPLKYKLDTVDSVEQQTKLYIPVAYFGAVVDDDLDRPGPIVGRDADALQCYQIAHSHLQLLATCGAVGSILIAVNAPGGSLP